MTARTITQPAQNSSLSSSVMRNQLQIIENEVADPASIDPGHLHTPAGVSATGVPSATTFWRGDNVWATPSASGTTLTMETPTGTVDDSNTTFSVAHTPVFILVNGGSYVAGTGIFSSYSNPNITLAAPVGTGGFIRSFYNA